LAERRSGIGEIVVNSVNRATATAPDASLEVAAAKIAIGITASVPFKPDGSLGDDIVPYVRAVERTGARAVPFRNELERLEEQLAGVQGVILSGGADVGVEHYGGRALAEVQQPRPDRDAFELALVPILRERGIPTLCVCRGLQLVNVALGGTLIEHLPHELGERYVLHHQQVHEDGEDRSEVVAEHLVRVEPESALARLLGTTAFATNSMHHQAVREPAPELRVVARTPDGVVEALDARFEHPFFFAVQWHPEELTDEAVSAKLFEGLVGAALQASLERA
jgi:putative glutamine amidotransferase